MSFPAFFDTNVLYGAYLNDFLLRLAERRIFRPLWSPSVLEELRRNLTSRFSEQAIDRRIAMMEDSFPDALVRGYTSLIGGMTCDPKDRHVLAAAIRGGAELLVTFNLDDFPHSSLEGLDVEVVHPDRFLLDQLDLYPGVVIGTLHVWSQDCHNPPLSVEELSRLARSGVPDFATEAFRHLDA